MDFMSNVEEKIVAELAFRRIKDEMSEIQTEYMEIVSELQRSKLAFLFSRLITFVGLCGLFTYVFWGNTIVLFVLLVALLLLTGYWCFNYNMSANKQAEPQLRALESRSRVLKKQLSVHSEINNFK